MSERPVECEDRSGASAVRWRMVALMMAARFLSGFNRVSISVAGTERLMEQYQLRPTQMGFVYSALLLACANSDTDPSHRKPTDVP